MGVTASPDACHKGQRLTIRFHKIDSASEIEGVVGSILQRDNLTFSACWRQETAMTALRFQHLTLDERRSLFRMQEARLGVAEMAVRLGRHRSTIYRELGRNR